MATDPQFRQGDDVVLQGTLLCKVVRVLPKSGHVIVAFGQATKVVSPLELARGTELEETDYS